MKFVLGFLVVGAAIIAGSVYFEFPRGIIFGGALVALTVLTKSMQIAHGRQLLPAGYLIKTLWVMGGLWFILLTAALFPEAPDFLTLQERKLFFQPMLVLYFGLPLLVWAYIFFKTKMESKGIEVEQYFNKHWAQGILFLALPCWGAMGFFLYALYKYGTLFFPDPVWDKTWSLAWPYLFGVGLPLLTLYIFFKVPVTIVKFGENQNLRNWLRLGRGGSARWAGPASFDKHKYNTSAVTEQLNGVPSYSGDGRIFFGKSLHLDAAWPSYVGIKDDAHMVTIGMTGSGKSTSVLFNNLPSWTGSAFILDPKGELSQYSYRQRGRHGRKAVVLDPFNQTGERNGIVRSSFNPLSEVDVKSQNVGIALANIAEGCVVDEGDKSRHWTELGKTVIEGLIAHFLTTRPRHQHNLPAIADTFLSIGDPEIDGAKVVTQFKELLVEMAGNPACGGIVQQASSTITNSGGEGYGNIISTVQRGLKWATDPAMRNHLVESDFSLSELANGRTTIYVVLPFDLIDISKQARWMRVLTNLAVATIQRAPSKPKTSVLFVLDEFYSLGYFPKIESSVVQMRGAGIKLWIFLQNLGQLQELYSRNWETFTGNSNTQILGLGNDNVTANWVAERIGYFVNGDDQSRPLMAASEVSIFLGKSAYKQIVLPVDGLPMRLQSILFENLIPKEFRDPVSASGPRPIWVEEPQQLRAPEPPVHVEMTHQARQNTSSEAVNAALRRYQMKIGYTEDELKEMRDFWQREKPSSLIVQILADYETLLPHAQAA